MHAMTHMTTIFKNAVANPKEPLHIGEAIQHGDCKGLQDQAGTTVEGSMLCSDGLHVSQGWVMRGDLVARTRTQGKGRTFTKVGYILLPFISGTSKSVNQ